MNGAIKGGVLFATAALLAVGCGVGTDEGDDLTATSEDLSHGKGKGRPFLADGGQGGKVTICHIPPGNPANAHTITVGAPAAWAHVTRHGDSLGPCGDVDAGEPEVDAGTPDPDAGTPDAGDPDGGGIN